MNIGQKKVEYINTCIMKLEFPEAVNFCLWIPTRKPEMIVLGKKRCHVLEEELFVRLSIILQ